MKRKIIGGALCLLLVAMFSLVLFGQSPNYPSLIPASAVSSDLIPAHNLHPPFPYTYYIIGQSWIDMAAVHTAWNWTYGGVPVWAMDDDDTASSHAFRFPVGANKAYLSAVVLADDAADSVNMKFGFQTRSSFAACAANYGTTGKGWYEVGTTEILSEDTQDSLQRTLLSFPTKAMGDEWRLSCDTYHATNHFHMHGFDSTVVCAAQVTFGFPGDKQYFVQIYPDPALSDEIGGDLFRIQGNVDATDSATADTSYTCFAPAFTNFTVWAVPDSYKANGSDSINAYIALDGKALRGLYDVTVWYPIDSINLDKPADSTGESMQIISVTEGFFDQYRIRYHQSADALSDSLETTVKVYGVFSP